MRWQNDDAEGAAETLYGKCMFTSVELDVLYTRIYLYLWFLTRALFHYKAFSRSSQRLAPSPAPLDVTHHRPSNRRISSQIRRTCHTPPHYSSPSTRVARYTLLGRICTAVAICKCNSNICRHIDLWEYIYISRNHIWIFRRPSAKLSTATTVHSASCLFLSHSLSLYQQHLTMRRRTNGVANMQLYIPYICDYNTGCPISRRGYSSDGW